MDAQVIDFYRSVFEDPGIDIEEASELKDFLGHLNPPPDKLTWLRAAAFKTACEYLQDDNAQTNIDLLRTINYIVHAIEMAFLIPKKLDNCVEIDEEKAVKFYKTLFDDLTIDSDENAEIHAFFHKANGVTPNSLVASRALAFKVGSQYLSNDKDTNIKLLRCINAIVHGLETSCMRPKPYELKDSADLEMNIQDAVQHLWELDANRLNPNDDYVLNVQKGKKPFWKEDAASDPLFTFVDPKCLARPTYSAFIALLDNYIAETGVEEVVTDAERQEVWKFLNAIMETKPMQFCHRYCHAKAPNRIPKDRQTFLKLLHTIWFDLYRREASRDSSGFEHVFVGEVKDGEVSGFHNWIKFYLEEKCGNLDYRGYIKPKGSSDAKADGNDHLLTLQFAWKGVEKFVGSSFIGVSPEFEFSLYTTCFLIGEEENNIELRTGGPENDDTYSVTIKCYRMMSDKIGTSFPEVNSHYEE